MIHSRRMTIAAVAALVVLGPSTSLAHAHEPPTPGSTCTTPGMVEDNHGTLYVCTATSAKSKPRWGKGLTQSPTALTLSDGWAKAADTGMSAAFGVVKNPTGKPIRVIAATSPYSTVTQVHKVVMQDGAMVMQQKSGGFIVPANGTVELKPGGNHLMLLALTKPITAGARVPLTLITSTGGTLTTTVMGKVFAGANEEYDGDVSTMSGM